MMGVLLLSILQTHGCYIDAPLVKLGPGFRARPSSLGAPTLLTTLPGPVDTASQG